MSSAAQSDAPVIDLRCGRWQDVLADVQCDALIVDAPYSERTHGGHDDGSKLDRFARHAVRITRRPLAFPCWTHEDVERFVDHWSPLTNGWFVSLTDHILAPVWEERLRRAGRYVFSPVAYIAPGSRVRLTGDGPSQWTTWIIVARPSSAEWSRWGTLPGGYVLPAGENDRRCGVSIPGGKELWLMRALVRDYSRPGDLICDPCAGGGTTLLAAAMENRKAIGAEMDPKHYEIARKRIAKGYTPSLLSVEREPAQQLALGDK